MCCPFRLKDEISFTGVTAEPDRGCFGVITRLNGVDVGLMIGRPRPCLLEPPELLECAKLSELLEYARPSELALSP